MYVRKYLIVLSLMFLVACGSGGTITVHVDIDDDLARDSNQIVELMEKIVTENEEDDSLFDQYLEKHLFSEEENYNEQELNLVIHTSSMIRNYIAGDYDGLESNKQQFYDDEESFYKILETGEE